MMILQKTHHAKKHNHTSRCISPEAYDEGALAAHIDESGRVYQIDVSHDHPVYYFPEEIPATVFNVGHITLNSDGTIDADLSVSLPGFSASTTLSGTLDSSLTAIYHMSSETRFTILGESQEFSEYNNWYRWAPDTGTFPFFDTINE